MIILIIVNLILQGSILPFFSFLVYLPNPALVSIAIISLFKGKYYGAFFGLFMFLFQDALFGDIIGIHALIYFLIGYGAGMLNNSLNNENTIIHIIFTAIATIAYNAMYFLIMFFLSRDISLAGSIKRIFSIEILYNCILAFILYKILYKTFRVSTLKFGNRKRW